MKKIIAVMLVFTMLFSLAACKKERKPSKLEETVPIDVEALKADWTNGELIINGKTIKIPCKVSEFVEQSGLKIGNADVLGEKILKSKQSVTLNIVGPSISFKIKALNVGKEEIGYQEAMVVKYDYNNTNEGNRQIKFAGTLSPGAARSAVEEALGIPEGQTTTDQLYHYKGKNADNKTVELIVAFNSYSVANSVSFEVKY